MLRALFALLLLAPAAAAAPLTITVTTDLDGERVPVPGARIVVRPAGEPIRAEVDLPASEIAADREGRARVDRPAGPVVVAAAMPGRGTAAVRVAAGVAEATIVLPPEAALAGVVLGPDGAPVAGAEVVAAPERPEDVGAFPTAGALLSGVAADSEGKFRIPRLAAGARYRVRATAEGLAPAVHRDVDPGAGPMTIGLTEGAVVRGLVIASPGGQPLAGAVVTAGEVSGRTDAEGRFELSGVPPGRVRLSAAAAGHVTWDERELVLAAGDLRVGIVLRALGASRLIGRVFSPSTEPVEGVEIFLRYPPDPELRARLPDGRFVRVAVSGPEGRFEARNLVPAQGVDLIARHSEFAPAVYLGYSFAPGATVDAVVLLKAGGRLAGRVVDEAGEPVPGARVVVRSDHDALPGAAEDEAAIAAAAVETVSDAEGRFVLAGVPPGDRMLVATAPGLVPAVLRGVEVAEGAVREDLVLVSGEGRPISGRVLAPSGAPVAGAEVSAKPAFGAAVAALTDEAGRFRIAGIPAGRYALRVSADGFAPLELPGVEAPAADLVLPLSPAAGIRGVVRRGDTSEAAAAVVRALVEIPPPETDPERIAWRTAAEVRAPDGVFQLPDLAPGRYRIEAWTDAAESGAVEGVMLVPGGSANVEIRVRPGQTIRGRVLSGASGRGVEGAVVALLGADGRPAPRTAVAGADGVFALTGAAPGFHDLIVKAEDHAPARVESVEVRPAVDTTVDDVVLGRGAEVRGIVLSDRAEPTPGAVVRLEAADRAGEAAAVADERGEFVFPHVAPGTWVLSVEAGGAGGGGSRRSRLIELAEGDAPYFELGVVGGTDLVGRVRRGVEPLRHATVRALRADGEVASDRVVHSARTDAEGDYEFPDLPPGPWILFVAPPGQEGAPAKFLVEVLSGPTQVHDLSLPESGVEGRVEDLDRGDPLGGAVLALVRAEAGDGGFLARLLAEPGEVASAADGTFRFAGVAPGRYRLVAHRAGYGQTSVEDVRVIPGGDVFVRVAMPPAGVLTGVVTDLDGRPLPGARVRFYDAGGALATADAFTTVDEEGRFRIDSLRTGLYTVEARAPGRAVVRQERVEVFRGAVPEVTLRLPAEGRLAASVFGPGGVPVEGARLRIRDFEGREIEAPRPPAGLLAPWRDPFVTDRSGEVIVANLAPGLYRITAERPGFSGAEVRVTVFDGEMARVPIVLLPEKR